LPYHQFRRWNLPFGSDVTEAPYKTEFTERVKRSGMRWKKESGQVILDLRVILLSGIWEQTRDAVLANRKPNLTVPPKGHGKKTPQIAA